DRRGLVEAVGPDHADHDVPQLDLARLHPRTRRLPEPVAVGAVGITEGVDDPRRAVRPVGDPVAVLQLRPDALGHRLGDQSLQVRLAHVLAIGVDQGAHHRVAAVRGDVDRHWLLAARQAGEAAQSTGRVELAQHLQAVCLDRLDHLGTRLAVPRFLGMAAAGGADQRKGQQRWCELEVGHCNASFGKGMPPAGAGPKRCSFRARLALVSSPMWTSSSRPSPSKNRVTGRPRAPVAWETLEKGSSTTMSSSRPTASRYSRISSPPSPWLAKTKVTCGLAAWPSASTAISRLQGGHQVAHRFTTFGCRPMSESRTGPPSRRVSSTSGNRTTACCISSSAPVSTPPTASPAPVPHSSGLRSSSERRARHPANARPASTAAQIEYPPSPKRSSDHGSAAYCGHHCTTNTSRPASKPTTSMSKNRPATGTRGPPGRFPAQRPTSAATPTASSRITSVIGTGPRLTIHSSSPYGPAPRD